MKIGVAGPIFTQKKHQNIYRKTTPILYIMGENNVAVIHIYGAKAIFLLLCIHPLQYGIFLELFPDISEYVGIFHSP